MIGVAIVGFGFMGRTHLGAYNAAAEAGQACRVHTICDPRRPDEQPDAGNLQTGAVTLPSDVHIATDIAEVLADPRIGLVSICTPTDTHVDLALRCLAAGKHVLVEKPIAIRSGDVRRLRDAVASAGAFCMPAMCMRFWPGWDWLRNALSTASFGRVHSASFQRLGSVPRWSAFYRDAQRSGSALFDLHIHDADFIRWCFGPPRGVYSTGTPEHLTTAYLYDGMPAHVTAEGGWDQQSGWGFRMRFVVNFERATADFDLARDPPLMLSQGGQCDPVELAPTNGYDGEVRYMLECIAGRRAPQRVTLDDALETTRLLEAEARSLLRGETVLLAASRA